MVIEKIEVFYPTGTMYYTVGTDEVKKIRASPSEKRIEVTYNNGKVVQISGFPYVAESAPKKHIEE